MPLAMRAAGLSLRGMMHRTFRRLLFLILPALVAAGTASADDFARGVTAFEAGDYPAAKEAFQAELRQRPNDPLASLWLGLTAQGISGGFEGAAEWRAATGHSRYEPIAKLFRGLTNWKAGWANDARAYFNDAQISTTTGRPVDYPPAKRALADLEAGNPVPALASWPEFAGLPTSRGIAPPVAKPGPPTAAPAPATPPALTPQPALKPLAGYVPWEPFRTHRAGDRVLFRVINDTWRVGVVEEVGGQGVSADKYLIAEEANPTSRNYYYYTDVAGLTRQDFWSGFFIGDWALGSGMAVNERREGSSARNEYTYVGSTERLVVDADGSFAWTTPKRQIKGRWEPHPSAPGIILRGGDRDRDYAVFNITDPATVSVMKEHHLRLQTPGIQSTLGRRKIPASR